MPVKTINPALRRAWMQKDGLHRPLAIASFGLMTPDKGFDQTLQALSALKDEFDFHYTLVGTENPYWDVREIIIRHGLGERVTITGHVSLEEFERYIASTDLAINLRSPHCRRNFRQSLPHHGNRSAGHRLRHRLVLRNS
jgi:glycosyltransferase involved in cell wall biosynthesis